MKKSQEMMKLFDDFVYAKGLEDSSRDVYYSLFDFKGTRDKLQAIADSLDWISVEDRLPESKCIALYINANGYPRRIMAEYIKKYTVDKDSDTEIELCEYSEETDDYYLQEGWWEVIENWEDFYYIWISQYTITHWKPLPEPPC